MITLDDIRDGIGRIAITFAIQDDSWLAAIILERKSSDEEWTGRWIFGATRNTGPATAVPVPNGLIVRNSQPNHSLKLVMEDGKCKGVYSGQMATSTMIVNFEPA